MQEQFTTIEGFENYAISTHGRVQRLTPGPKTYPGLIKTIYVNKTTGYTHTKVSGSEGKRSMAIHRLVATTFIPNPEGHKEIDHIDRNKTNNRVDNLRWVTRRENMANIDARKSLKPVWAFPPDGGEPLFFPCIADAAKWIAETTGQVYFSQGISSVLTKPNYTHYKGWRFEIASTV